MCFLCARGRVKVITKSKKPTWRGDIFFNQMNTKSLHFAFSERSDCGCIFASVFILALYIYIYIRSLFVLLIISLMHKVDMFALLLWWSFLLRRVDTFLERWTKVNGKWKINIQAEWHYGMKCLCVQYIYIWKLSGIISRLFALRRMRAQWPRLSFFMSPWITFKSLHFPETTQGVCLRWIYLCVGNGFCLFLPSRRINLSLPVGYEAQEWWKRN